MDVEAALHELSGLRPATDSETGDDSTNFAISDASFNLYKVGQIPASGGATFEPVAPFTDSTAYPVDCMVPTDASYLFSFSGTTECIPPRYPRAARRHARGGLSLISSIRVNAQALVFTTVSASA